MSTVTFLPFEKTITAAPGMLLLDAARSAGVEIDAHCGGEGTCGKCLVRVVSGTIDRGDQGPLTDQACRDGYALACTCRVKDTAITLEIPDAEEFSGGKFVDGDGAGSHRHSVGGSTPLVSRMHLMVQPPVEGDGLSDQGRVEASLRRVTPEFRVAWALSALRELSGALRGGMPGTVTLTLAFDDAQSGRIIDVEPGHADLGHHGIAVDIGTTTVAVTLVRLPQAAVLASHTDYNGQIRCGLDVISRINYAREPARLEELRSRVVDTINALVAVTCREAGIDARQILSAAVSGNTTMTHLFLGLPPENIRLAPYTPTALETVTLVANDLHLQIHPQALVRVSPGVGSYVGGDITAGLLCTELAGDRVRLFLDIGTNGEIVVGNKDFLMACACSAGPAFEGGGITCGMRAARGAIERVRIDPATGAADVRTIGNVAPTGICGSGIISLVAELFVTGWIDPAGKLSTRPCGFILREGRSAHFVLVPVEKSGTGQAIIVTESDIENIIRAKAAVYSACSLMLSHAGVGFTDCEGIDIAGGFGRFLDIEHAITIGMLPDVAREKFHLIGNTSLSGTFLVLCSYEQRQKQEEITRRITYLDLSAEPSYMEHYTAALFLPHTRVELFPTTAASRMGVQ